MTTSLGIATGKADRGTCPTDYGEADFLSRFGDFVPLDTRAYFDRSPCVCWTFVIGKADCFEIMSPDFQRSSAGRFTEIADTVYQKR